MAASDFGTIVEIGDVLVSEDVVCEYFACDYEACGGICCIEGDSGAPLEEEELESLEGNYPRYSDQMSGQGRARIDEVGFFEVDREEDLVTPCIPETGECAYCIPKQAGEDPAKRSVMCAIELAGCAKPVSCALYPIRITKMPGGGHALNLHRWKICSAAYEKGRREGTRVYQFLKKPLERRFGPEFYKALDAAAKHLNQ